MIRSAFWSRFVLPLLVAFLLSLTSVTQASAQSFTSPNTESNVPKNLSTLTQSVFIEVVSALNCQLSGYSPSSSNQKCLGVNPKTGQSVVTDIGDAGPAQWTGKHLGGSPEVMQALGYHTGPRKGAVLYFFINDPGDTIPLGPIKAAN